MAHLVVILQNPPTTTDDVELCRDIFQTFANLTGARVDLTELEHARVTLFGHPVVLRNVQDALGVLVTEETP